MEKYRVKYADLFKELFAPAAIFTPLDKAAHHEFAEARFDKWSKYFVKDFSIDNEVNNCSS